MLFNRFLLSKHSSLFFLASIAVFLVKNVQSINRARYFVMRKLFLLENCFTLRYERMNIETKGIVNELVKAYTEGLLRPPCCSLNDFYCQNIQGQFSRRLLHFFL